MITYLKRKEILLPAIPLLFLVIEEVWFEDNLLDLHFYDTMYVILKSHVFLSLLLLMILYLLMHLILRGYKWRSNTICNIHVAGTVICLGIICICLLVQNLAPVDSIDADAWKNSWRNDLFAWLVSITLVVFIIFQILFLLYFIYTIVRKP